MPEIISSENRWRSPTSWSFRHWCAIFMLAMLAVIGFMASPVAAHPLGNFTVNRYARLEVSAGQVRVHYVLDLAEIPAFQVRKELEADRRRFARNRAEEIGRGLRLNIEGRRLDLRRVGQRLSEPPGQGGLRTLRLEVSYEADISELDPDAVVAATFEDTNELHRIGWREIVAVARGDAVIVRADVPSEDASNELRRYPEELNRSPLDRRQATVLFKPGRLAVEAIEGDQAAAERIGGSGGFAALVTRQDRSVLGTFALLAVAVGFGAVHALGPGHGKTIMAAYVAGDRGRPRDALFLGCVVASMHTGSVLVVGLALVALDQRVDAERIYPVLTALSGALVVAIGGWLLLGRVRARLGSGRTARAHGHPHDHASHSGDDRSADHSDGDEHDDAHHHHQGAADGHTHDDHGHGHGHRHGRGHGHTHELPSGVAPLSRAGLVALGGAGGLLPSPSALLVLLSAVALQRVVFGLLLITAFSIGLAAALTAVGLALVYGRSMAERSRLRNTLDMLPVLGAVALVGAGIVLAARGLSAL